MVLRQVVMGLPGFRDTQVLDIGIRPYTLSPKT